MPRIDPYEQRTRATTGMPGVVELNSGGAAGDLARVFENVADDRLRLRAFAQQKEEERDAVEANLALQRESSFEVEDIQRREQNAPEDGAGHTEGMLKDFDTRAAELLKGVTTQKVRNVVRQQLAARRTNLLAEGQAFETRKVTEFKVRGVDQARDHAMVAANFRPDDFAMLAAEHNAGIEASGLPADVKSAKMLDGVQSIAYAAVQGTIQRNPYDALKELNTEKSENLAVRALPFDLRQRLRGAAETEIRAREAEARARQAEARDLLTGDLADAFAARQAGLPAEMPSRGRFAAAYGGADGAKRYADAQESWGVFDVVAQAAHQAPVDAAKTLERLKPNEQSGAAADSRRYESAVQLWSEQRKQLEADPVGTLLARDPALAAQAQEAKDPRGQAKFIQMVRAKQEALGVAEPRLLPDATRDAIARQLAFNPEKPGARMQTLQGIRDMYGAAFPQIVGEIAPKLDGHARVLVNMSPEDGQRLDAALAQNPSDVAKLLTSGAAEEIKSEIEVAFEPLAATFADNPDAESRLVEHREAAIALAQSLVIRGTSPQDAARQASAAVVNKRYEYRDTMRIPREFDADAIARSANNRRFEVSKEDLTITPGVHSDNAAAQADIREHVLKQGYWITNEDESGLVLRIPHRRGQGEVYDKRGDRVEFTWSQLMATAPSEFSGLGTGAAGSR